VNYFTFSPQERSSIVSQRHTLPSHVTDWVDGKLIAFATDWPETIGGVTKMPMRRFGRSTVAGIVLMFGMAGAVPAWADCIPRNLATPAPQDAVARVLAAQSACPENAIQFVEALERMGAHMEPTMVNFVGFHNPDPGAFFIFEIVSSAGTPSPTL
jgi:hypothetical protein